MQSWSQWPTTYSGDPHDRIRACIPPHTLRLDYGPARDLTFWEEIAVRRDARECFANREKSPKQSLAKLNKLLLSSNLCLCPDCLVCHWRRRPEELGQ